MVAGLLTREWKPACWDCRVGRHLVPQLQRCQELGHPGVGVSAGNLPDPIGLLTRNLAWIISSKVGQPFDRSHRVMYNVIRRPSRKCRRPFSRQHSFGSCTGWVNTLAGDRLYCRWVPGWYLAALLAKQPENTCLTRKRFEPCAVSFSGIRYVTVGTHSPVPFPGTGTQVSPAWPTASPILPALWSGLTPARAGRGRCFPRAPAGPALPDPVPRGGPVRAARTSPPGPPADGSKSGRGVQGEMGRQPGAVN